MGYVRVCAHKIHVPQYKYCMYVYTYVCVHTYAQMYMHALYIHVCAPMCVCDNILSIQIYMTFASEYLFFICVRIFSCYSRNSEWQWHAHSTSSCFSLEVQSQAVWGCQGSSTVTGPHMSSLFLLQRSQRVFLLFLRKTWISAYGLATP